MPTGDDSNPIGVWHDIPPDGALDGKTIMVNGEPTVCVLGILAFGIVLTLAAVPIVLNLIEDWINLMRGG